MKKLNRVQIKYLVTAAMLLDHIGWAFFATASLPGQIFHFVGRLTGPVMAFFLEEGYEHTRDSKKYAVRLGVFALVSSIPYSLFETGKIFGVKQSVMFTLFLGFLAVWIWDRAPWSEEWKKAAVAGLCILSVIGDWPVMDVLWPLMLFRFRGDSEKQWNAFLAVSAVAFAMSFAGWEPVWAGTFSAGIFLPYLLLRYGYSGELGSSSAFHKWFFYLFYPAHLLLLWAVKTYMV